MRRIDVLLLRLGLRRPWARGRMTYRLLRTIVVVGSARRVS